MQKQTEEKRYVICYFLEEQDKCIYQIVTLKELQKLKPSDVINIWELGKHCKLLTTVV
jgi:hypothetical protein